MTGPTLHSSRRTNYITGSVLDTQKPKGAYTYSSSPRALYTNKKLLKSPISEAPIQYANLMFERRVVRGNTYAQRPMSMGDGESQAAKIAEARRRALARRKAKGQKDRSIRLRLLSPPAVSGRRHEKIQTEKYLEELWEKPVEFDMSTQTDLMYDRPMSPFYIPVKTGKDVSTQIYPGDLFDFDIEVQPILEVLVGKTIDQALIEVFEEEELAALREQQRRFIEIRASELAETQRLEEQERRLRAEKDRRTKEYEDGCRTQQETEERIAAAILTQGYMADLIPSLLIGLNESGFLYDNIKQDVDENFMPWLMKEVTQEMDNMVNSRDLLMDIVKEILETRADIYAAMNVVHEDRASEEEDNNDIELAQHNVILENAALEVSKSTMF